MNVIFVGSLYPQERENEIINNSKGLIDNAANNLQWALLKGLDFFYSNLQVITLPVIRSYPFGYTKWMYKGADFSHKEGALDYCLSFVNIPLIKMLNKSVVLKKKLDEIIIKQEKTIIIIYSLHSPFLKAAYRLKKQNPNVRICLITPDLPQFMSGNNNLVYRFAKYIDACFIKKYITEVDAFVLLTKHMKEMLNVGERPFTVVEGIYNSTIQTFDKCKKEYKTVLYTGNISHRYGIMKLIDAFGEIKDKDYRLWICGNGDGKNSIIQAAKRDNRIEYLGQLKTTEVVQLQKRATVLVNPRTAEGDYTKYSFPSKTIEYLVAGTPCVLYKLDGIPDEYDEYCNYVDGQDTEALKAKIVEVAERSEAERNEQGILAQSFILKNKVPEKQCEKIFNLINAIR